MEEQDNKKNKVEQLTDEQLNQVTGGAEKSKMFILFRTCLKQYTPEMCCTSSGFGFGGDEELRQQCKELGVDYFA